MKRFLIPITGFLLLFFTLGSIDAEAQRVEDYITSDSLQVGDTFTFTITLSKDQPYDQIIFPDTANFPDDVELLDLRRFKVTDFKDSLVYNLQFFGTDDASIDRLPVHLINGTDTTTLYTTPAPLRFKSAITGEQDEQFKPFKPIFDFARMWWPWLVGGLALILIAWYLYRKYQQREPKPEPKPTEPPPPFVDPIEELDQAITDLKSDETLTQKRDFKTFYIKLGDAIRNYFERLYEIPALELTSREILQEMNSMAVDRELIDATRKVLNEADMVKFAKFTPTLDQAHRALEKAQNFVERARSIDRQRVERMRKRHEDWVQEYEEAQKEQEQESEMAGEA